MEQDLNSLTVTLSELLAQFLDYLPKLIAALVVFVIGLVLTMLLVSALNRTLVRRKVDPSAATVIVRLTRISLLILTVVVSLQLVGFNLTAFLTGLGILGFTIGFALQDISKNFVAGILLLIQQPFKVGETIELDPFTGKVLAIEMRTTRIMTLDGLIVDIPNGDVLTSPIINYSQGKERRIMIDLGVASDSDPGQVRQVVCEAIEGIPGLLEEPAPQVVFHNFGESTLDCQLYFWVATEQISPVEAKDLALEAVNRALLEAGIDMPFPIQTMVLRSES